LERRIDEKILSIINEEEKKEARKNICDGQIKIGENYYEFEEKDFFDEKLKMYIPNSFEDMSLDARKLKYPSESRPEIIKCNEDGSIAITLKVIDSRLDEENVDYVSKLMKLMIQRLNPSNLFFKEGILEVDNKNVGYFDCKSSAVDDFLYNFIFFLEFQKKTLMGTFSCIYDEHREWKDVIFEILKTIRVIKEEEVI
jgi:hypothetical protein